ncbi:hypothetical protein [Sinorhizobium glycinis]|uniref:hypothetical protein n=1 Tax=Sinorhizobium glycinis TaxID=1472378 RepID=UPI0012E7A478|nr:hypothetical protein [Sinorhizobium glycinis]
MSHSNIGARSLFAMPKVLYLAHQFFTRRDDAMCSRNFTSGKYRMTFLHCIILLRRTYSEAPARDLVTKVDPKNCSGKGKNSSNQNEFAFSPVNLGAAPASHLDPLISRKNNHLKQVNISVIVSLTADLIEFFRLLKDDGKLFGIGTVATKLHFAG